MHTATQLRRIVEQVWRTVHFANACLPAYTYVYVGKQETVRRHQPMVVAKPVCVHVYAFRICTHYKWRSRNCLKHGTWTSGDPRVCAFTLFNLRRWFSICFLAIYTHHAETGQGCSCFGRNSLQTRLPLQPQYDQVSGPPSMSVPSAKCFGDPDIAVCIHIRCICTLCFASGTCEFCPGERVFSLHGQTTQEREAGFVSTKSPDYYCLSTWG